MEFLEAKHPEWSQIWEELAQHPLNQGDAICRNNGYVWEYMGSTDDHHNLRHRFHPKTHKKEYMYLERRRSIQIASWHAAIA